MNYYRFEFSANRSHKLIQCDYKMIGKSPFFIITKYTLDLLNSFIRISGDTVVIGEDKFVIVETIAELEKTVILKANRFYRIHKFMYCLFRKTGHIKVIK